MNTPAAQPDLQATLDRLRKLETEIAELFEQLPDRAPEVMAAFEKDGKRGIERLLKEIAFKMEGRVLNALNEIDPALASRLSRRDPGRG